MSFGTQPALYHLAILNREQSAIMLRLALLFLVIAVVSGAFGFGVVANLSFEAARLLFFVFLVLAALIVLGSAWRGGGNLREYW